MHVTMQQIVGFKFTNCMRMRTRLRLIGIMFLFVNKGKWSNVESHLMHVKYWLIHYQTTHGKMLDKHR